MGSTPAHAVQDSNPDTAPLQAESQRGRFRDGWGPDSIAAGWMDGCGFAPPFVFLLFLLSSSSSSHPSAYLASDSLPHRCFYSLHYSHSCSSRRDMSQSSNWRKGPSDPGPIRPFQVFCLDVKIKLCCVKEASLLCEVEPR